MINQLVSIIIPTYNRAKLLVRALDSVKNQQHRPIEILVVDDGSTDNTSEIVQLWTQKNVGRSLNVLYISKSNSGPSASRNVGIEHASGEYIYFLDSDDYMHNNLLKNAVEILEIEDSDCVIFGFDCENFSGTVRQYLPPAQPALQSFLAGCLWGYTPSSLKRASLVRQVGPWSESQKIGEDYEYLGRSLLKATKSSVLRERLLTVYQNHYSLGDQKDTAMGLSHRLLSEKSIVEQLHKQRGEISTAWLNAYANRLFKTGVNMYAKGEIDFARKIGLLAAKLDVRPQRLRHKLTRFAWHRGRWSSLIWFKLARVHAAIRQQRIGLHEWSFPRAVLRFRKGAS